MVTAFHIFEPTVDQLNLSLEAYVSDTSARVADSVGGLAYALLSIYICLWGWALMRGVISESVADGATRIVRLVVITALAINVGIYNGYLAHVLWSSPDALASMVAAGPLSTPNAQFLDVLMSQMYDLGDSFWVRANAKAGLVPDFGLLTMAIIIWVAGLVATAYGAFLLALSKIALALLLGIGPIFVLALIFDSTRRFFDAWLGQCLNYVFLVLLAACGIKLILTVLASYLASAEAAGLLEAPTVNQAFPAIGICVIAALVLMQLPSIAASLGGGVAVSTLGALNYAFDRARGTVSAARPTNMRRSANRLRSDARIVGAAASATGAAPMAIYRKVTGQTRNRVSKD